MRRILFFLSIIIFSIFLGSQITEGFLLVPYWKTLSKKEFYEYYSNFGTIIGRFYTILTIISVLIPLSISIYCLSIKSRAIKYSVTSSFFAFLIVAIFYIYFKDTNQQFYQSAYEANRLKSELGTWEYMHWLRILIEIICLVFLIFTLNMLGEKGKTIDT